MLAGKKLKLHPYKKTEAINNIIENRRITGGNPYQGVNKFYADLRAGGYDVFEISSTGFEGLGSNSSGKYVCVWNNVSPTTTAYTIASSNINRHEDVIITGIHLDSAYRIDEFDKDLYLTLSSDYSGKLQLMFMNLYLSTDSTNTMENLKFKNLNLQAGYRLDFENLTLDGVNWLATEAGAAANVKKLVYTSTDYYANNVNFEAEVLSTTQSVPPQFGSYNVEYIK
jgi:hypothetical protein